MGALVHASAEKREQKGGEHRRRGEERAQEGETAARRGGRRTAGRERRDAVSPRLASPHCGRVSARGCSVVRVTPAFRVERKTRLRRGGPRGSSRLMGRPASPRAEIPRLATAARAAREGVAGSFGLFHLRPPGLVVLRCAVRLLLCFCLAMRVSVHANKRRQSVLHARGWGAKQTNLRARPRVIPLRLYNARSRVNPSSLQWHARTQRTHTGPTLDTCDIAKSTHRASRSRAGPSRAHRRPRSQGSSSTNGACREEVYPRRRWRRGDTLVAVSVDWCRLAPAGDSAEGGQQVAVLFVVDETRAV